MKVWSAYLILLSIGNTNKPRALPGSHRTGVLMKNTIVILIASISLQAMAADSTCDYQAMSAETQEMKQDLYWMKRTQEFADQMNQTYPRGCSATTNDPTKGLEIFMDDLEFTGPTDSSRVLAYSGSYGTAWGSQNGKDQIFLSSTDVDFYQPGVSEIRVYLQQGHMVLLAKTCSPKVALANLIAYAPYALNARCGGNGQQGSAVGQAIQTKVDEILNGESK